MPTMLHFEGDKDFARPPAELWTKLSDVCFLVECIPDVQSVNEAAADHAVCVIRPGFSFVRGTLKATIRKMEEKPPESLRLQVASKAIGSTTTLETGFSLASAGPGTRVHWSADIVQLTGLLKAVPQGLIRAAAEKVIHDIWAQVESRLAG
jgi:carbon monoxide dehydrogenase subunit G